MRLHSLAAAALALAATSYASLAAQPPPYELRCEFEGNKNDEFRECRVKVQIAVPTALYRVVCDGEEIFAGGFGSQSATLPESDPNGHDSAITMIYRAADGKQGLPIVKFDDRLFEEFRDTFARLYLRRHDSPMLGTCDGRFVTPTARTEAP